MKNFLLIICFISLSTQIYSQQKNYHLDTIIIEINEHIIVKITSYDNAWLNQYEGFSSRVEQFQKDVSNIRNEIPRDKNILIISEKIGEITLKITGDSKNYIIEKSLDSFRINRAIIRAQKYEIFIEFQEVDKLLSTDIQKYVNNIAISHERDAKESHNLRDYSAKAEKRHAGVAFNLYFKCENDSAVFDPNRSRYNDMKSQLGIDPNVGLGIAQNKLITDFGLRIAIIQTDMGILRNQYYTSYNMIYDFDQDQTFYLNHFINLGYRRNFSNKTGKYRWFGAEIGYLVKSNGKLFTSPTFKLGVLINVSKNINLTPEIYFDNKFQKIYPGIRLGIDIFNW